MPVPFACNWIAKMTWQRETQSVAAKRAYDREQRQTMKTRYLATIFYMYISLHFQSLPYQFIQAKSMLKYRSEWKDSWGFQIYCRSAVEECPLFHCILHTKIRMRRICLAQKNIRKYANRYPLEPRVGVRCGTRYSGEDGKAVI